MCVYLVTTLVASYIVRLYIYLGLLSFGVRSFSMDLVFNHGSDRAELELVISTTSYSATSSSGIICTMKHLTTILGRGDPFPTERSGKQQWRSSGIAPSKSRWRRNEKSECHWQPRIPRSRVGGKDGGVDDREPAIKSLSGVAAPDSRTTRDHEKPLCP
jgi:hypothetical protein